MDLKEVGGGRGDWMELAQDRDRWRALVGTVRDFSGSINVGNFLTSCKVYWLASQDGLCSMEYVATPEIFSRILGTPSIVLRRGGR
jgi:hypothetical protein